MAGAWFMPSSCCYLLMYAPIAYAPAKLGRSSSAKDLWKKKAFCARGAEAPEYLQQLRRRPEGRLYPNIALFRVSLAVAWPQQLRNDGPRSFSQSRSPMETCTTILLVASVPHSRSVSEQINCQQFVLFRLNLRSLNFIILETLGGERLRKSFVAHRCLQQVILFCKDSFCQ